VKLPNLGKLFEAEMSDLDAERLKRSIVSFLQSEIEWYDTLKDIISALRDKFEGEPQRLAAAKPPKPVRSKKELIRLVQIAGDWKDWYENNINFIKRIFGEDEENLKIFMKMLAATSQGATVAANVSLAIAAFKKAILEGKTNPRSFKGLDAARRSLSAIAKGGDPMGPKVGPYGRAMAGDKDAVAVDRHIFEIVFGSQSDSEGKRTVAFETLAAIAEEMGLENRQVQAALWAANQIRKGVTPGNYVEYLDRKRHELQKILDDISGLDIQRVSGLFEPGPKTT
jgi:hypothetical protein